VRTKRLVVRVRVPIEIDYKRLRHGELRQRPLLSWSVQHNTPRQSELNKPTTKHRNETDYSLQQQFEHVEYGLATRPAFRPVIPTLDSQALRVL
jgi:hypothetical protein